jgi:hypothetical protein
LEAPDIESAVRDLEPNWLARLAGVEEADRMLNALTISGGA